MDLNDKIKSEETPSANCLPRKYPGCVEACQCFFFKKTQYIHDVLPIVAFQFDNRYSLFVNCEFVLDAGSPEELSVYLNQKTKR